MAEPAAGYLLPAGVLRRQKWLELLKQIVPGVTRAAVLRDPANPSGTGQFGAIQAVAPSHSRYSPLDRSTAQGDLCHEASARPVTQPNHSSASRSIDNCLDGIFLHR